MNIILEIHLGFAFFVFLVALFIGWVQLGRRVLVTVIGIQILLGLIVAGVAGASHLPLPGMIWLHIVAALLAMGTYIAARRMLDASPKNLVPAIVLSFIGLVLIAFTIWYGSQLTLTHGL